ncbi:Zinc finger A20 and AN1 domain-containing stress-associated protein 2 [Striga hermonthica]|uniref:Zinc finger A20 and AN1 domain-containing stress-associated protein 2 n=1 Tax=Striga hermonthica TaxID=68872 RepID=A0A9N7MXB5_STRHE|nr:Zinc finger A20 and AN1 domain-containing stress-associated protein 2 [Striga hermonthica]
MEHDEMGCQPPPEGPILCVNNCGFFGSPANMNMCSKCYKDTILKQQQPKVVSTSIEGIINGGSLLTPILQNPKPESSKLKETPGLSAGNDGNLKSIEANKTRSEGPNRCTSCRKRVGLTGFKCKCGDLFCGTHRYSDKHDCPFDYQAAGKDEIARANPVVKAEKLDKI